MLITDVDGSIGVSQIAPGSLSTDRRTDKPSGSCEKSWDCWDLVVGALPPSLCHSSSVLVCSVPSCCQPLVSPQLFVPLQPPLGKHFDVTCVSFVTSKHQPAAPHPLSCHFTALLFTLFKSQQREKGSTALGSKLVTKINVKTSVFVGWSYTGNADSLSISCFLTVTRNKTSALE